MENDFCVRCGSHEIKTVEKHIQFTFPNPGTVDVNQKCNECQDCGETYFSTRQITELSHKIQEEKEKVESL